MSEPIVELRKVNKFYGDNHVVKDLDLTVYRGEFLSILGPSGCGKTTTLRMISGFEDPASGSVYLDGKRIDGLEPHKRGVNTVFQNYALFPHLSVHDNVAYGPRMKGTRRRQWEPMVREALAMVRLTGFETRYPNQLSGGQRQRVAIARAIVNRPQVLLLDEPLGALDMKLRKEMQVELKLLQRDLGITFIYVTHDQEEALSMSDRVGVMHEGRLAQLDSPRVMYNRPLTKFVAGFLGEANVYDAVIQESSAGRLILASEAGLSSCAASGFEVGELVHISVRPENTRFSLEPVSGFSLSGVARERVYLGNAIKTIVILPNGQEFRLNAGPDDKLPPLNVQLYVHWAEGDAVAMHSVGQMVYTAINEPFAAVGNGKALGALR